MHARLIAQGKAKVASIRATLRQFADSLAPLAGPDPLPIPLRSGPFPRSTPGEWIDLRYDAGSDEYRSR
jgi:hypothetical protein